MHEKMKGVDPDANYRLRQPVKERGEEDRGKRKPREKMEKEANWRRKKKRRWQYREPEPDWMALISSPAW